jgi:TRAP-type C4-dicarboxylate transport system permease small subunit
MIVLCFVAVLFRYTPGISPIFWSEELLRYLFVWIVFLSISISIERNELLEVDVLTKHLPKEITYVVAIIGNLLACGFEIALVIAGAKMTHFNYAQRASTLPIRMSWVYLAIPIGMVLASTATIIQIGKILKQRQI